MRHLISIYTYYSVAPNSFSTVTVSHIHSCTQKSLLEQHGKAKSLLPGSERKILQASNICIHLASSGSAEGSGGKAERGRVCGVGEITLMDSMEKMNHFSK